MQRFLRDRDPLLDLGAIAFILHLRAAVGADLTRVRQQDCAIRLAAKMRRHFRQSLQQTKHDGDALASVLTDLIQGSVRDPAKAGCLRDDPQSLPMIMLYSIGRGSWTRALPDWRRTRRGGTPG